MSYNMYACTSQYILEKKNTFNGPCTASYILDCSGRCSRKQSLELVHTLGFCVQNKIPVNHGLAVTVPGAAAAWCDTVSSFGSGMVCVTLTASFRFITDTMMDVFSVTWMGIEPMTLHTFVPMYHSVVKPLYPKTGCFQGLKLIKFIKDLFPWHRSISLVFLWGETEVLGEGLPVQPTAHKSSRVDAGDQSWTAYVGGQCVKSEPVGQLGHVCVSVIYL